MKRMVFEVGMVVAVIVLGLEAVHYREAVLACNIDRKRAWKTVVELREKSEAQSPPGSASALVSAPEKAPAEKPRPSGAGAR